MSRDGVQICLMQHLRSLSCVHDEVYMIRATSEKQAGRPSAHMWNSTRFCDSLTCIVQGSKRRYACREHKLCEARWRSIGWPRDDQDILSLLLDYADARDREKNAVLGRED